MKNSGVLQQRLLSTILVFTLAIAIFVSIFVMLLYAGVITYSQSPSIGIGFYLVVGSDIKEGDLVVFPNPRTDLVDSPRLLKRVVKITGSYCTVEGRSSEELEKATGVSGLVSFDSTYFGDIEISSCKKAIPLRALNSLLN